MRRLSGGSGVALCVAGGSSDQERQLSTLRCSLRRVMPVKLFGELMLVCYMSLALLAFCSNCVAVRESPEATVLRYNSC